jgi:hypothetical protein
VQPGVYGGETTLLVYMAVTLLVYMAVKQRHGLLMYKNKTPLQCATTTPVTLLPVPFSVFTTGQRRHRILSPSSLQRHTSNALQVLTHRNARPSAGTVRPDPEGDRQPCTAYISVTHRDATRRIRKRQGRTDRAGPGRPKWQIQAPLFRTPRARAKPRPSVPRPAHSRPRARNQAHRADASPADTRASAEAAEPNLAAAFKPAVRSRSHRSHPGARRRRAHASPAGELGTRHRPGRTAGVRAVEAGRGQPCLSLYPLDSLVPGYP